MSITKPAPLDLASLAIAIGDTAAFVSKFNAQQSAIQAFANQLNMMCDSIISHIGTALNDYPGIYLGVSTTPPIQGIAGEALQLGMIYHHDPDNGDPLEVRLYGASGWEAINMSPASILAALLTVDVHDSGLNATTVQGYPTHNDLTVLAGQFLMRTGSYGLGSGQQTAINNINLGSAQLPVGFYSGAGWLGTPLGDVDGATYFYLQVENLANDWPNHIKHTLTAVDGKTWTRTKVGGIWGAWQGAASASKAVIDLGAVGGLAGDETVMCDLSAGTVFQADLSAASTAGTLTFDFTGLPDTTDQVVAFDLQLKRGGRKALAFTCNGKTLRWSGNVAPVLSISTLYHDILSFHVLDDGALKAAHSWAGLA